MGFVDGTQIGTTSTHTGVLQNISSNLVVGRLTDGAGTKYGLDGWIDELRISKGIARWTSDFIPPTSAYGISFIGSPMWFF